MEENGLECSSTPISIIQTNYTTTNLWNITLYTWWFAMAHIGNAESCASNMGINFLGVVLHGMRKINWETANKSVAHVY